MFVIVNEGSSGSRNIYWLKKYKKIWSEDEKKEKAAARQDGEMVQREAIKTPSGGMIQVKVMLNRDWRYVEELLWSEVEEKLKQKKYVLEEVEE